jgi:hypothetical protein
MEKRKVKNISMYISWIIVLVSILVLHLLIGGARVSAQEGASVFILPDTQVIPVGGETEMEVRVADVNNLYGFEFHLTFDAEMVEVIDSDPDTEGTQINPGDLLIPGTSANTSLNQVDNAQGTIDFAMTLVAGDTPVSGSGILATIGIRCLSQGTTEIIFENPVDGQAPVKLADGDGKPITVTWYGASVTVTEGTCGDVNDDGNVNMADVMILWYDIADYPSVGAWTVSNEWAADVNCDGNVNMADVMILWYDIADYPSAGAWEVNCCE